MKEHCDAVLCPFNKNYQCTLSRKIHITIEEKGKKKYLDVRTNSPEGDHWCVKVLTIEYFERYINGELTLSPVTFDGKERNFDIDGNIVPQEPELITLIKKLI